MRAVFALFVAVLAVGCGDSQPLFGPPTETACPSESTLTYDNFGREFMESYCTRCHDSALIGDEARMGAPSFHDFDTLFGIRAVSDHIDETAGFGPAATNDSMPPNGDRPTPAEREKLAEWIACEMPE